MACSSTAEQGAVNSLVAGSNPATPACKNSSAVEHLVYTEAAGGSIPSSCMSQLRTCTMITVRCKQCNKEIRSDHHTHCCGCPNMMTVIEDKVTAVDLSKVVMVQSQKETKPKSYLSQSDLSFQEERRKRKVRKLDFDVR